MPIVPCVLGRHWVRTNVPTRVGGRMSVRWAVRTAISGQLTRQVRVLLCSVSPLLTKLWFGGDVVIRFSIMTTVSSFSFSWCSIPFTEFFYRVLPSSIMTLPTALMQKLLLRFRHVVVQRPPNDAFVFVWCAYIILLACILMVAKH